MSIGLWLGTSHVGRAVGSTGDDPALLCIGCGMVTNDRSTIGLVTYKPQNPQSARRDHHIQKRRTALEFHESSASRILDGVQVVVSDLGDDPQLGRNGGIAQPALGEALDFDT